jgi:FkbM family methyltransferase
MDRTVVKEVFMEEIYDKHRIKVEKGDTVLDIGAHIGVFGVYAAAISKTGIVYSFEPFIDNFKMLEAHKEINNCFNLKSFNDGVGDKKGKQTLFLSPDNNTGGHSLVLKTHSENKVEITTVSQSEFCEEEKINKIDFLKLDGEGVEFNILEKNEAILKRVNKIIMECQPFAENTVDKMIKLLDHNNFSVI